MPPSYTLSPGDEVQAVDPSTKNEAFFPYYPEDGPLDEQVLRALHLDASAHCIYYRSSKKGLVAAAFKLEEKKKCKPFSITFPQTQSSPPPQLNDLNELRDGDRVRVKDGDYTGYIIYRERKGDLLSQAWEGVARQGKQENFDLVVELREDGVTVVARPKDGQLGARVVLLKARAAFLYDPQAGTLVEQAIAELRHRLDRQLVLHWTTETTMASDWRWGPTVIVTEHPTCEEVNHIRTPLKGGEVVWAEAHGKLKGTARFVFDQSRTSLSEQARKALERELGKLPAKVEMQTIDRRHFGKPLELIFDVGGKRGWLRHAWMAAPAIGLAVGVGVGRKWRKEKAERSRVPIWEQNWSENWRVPEYTPLI